MSVGFSVISLPGHFKETKIIRRRERERQRGIGERCQMPGYDMKDASLGVWCLLLKKKKKPEKQHCLGLISHHSFAIKSSRGDGFLRPVIPTSFFAPLLAAMLRQLEKKLILGVADSRSRLKDKWLITMEGAGAGAGRRRRCHPLPAPGGSHQRLNFSQGPAIASACL